MIVWPFEAELSLSYVSGAGLESPTIRGYGELPGCLDLGLSAECLHLTDKLGVEETRVAVEEIIRLGVPRRNSRGRDGSAAMSST